MKRRVLLTGASGSMGHEAFLELLRRSDSVQTRLLLRPSKVNRERFAKYEGREGVEIIWGDLQQPEDVLRAVTGVDFVLHPAALISPEADRNPQRAREVNVGGCRNLIDAIRAQPGGGRDIRFVYVGSVAQYGDRLPPHEVINVGDPIKPSVHDYYALTKNEAEAMVIESGLEWASLRQTWIAIPDTLSLLDPIMFHQPLDQRIELITARDAGFGLVQCIDAPDEFWGRVYNMSGGPHCRVSYAEYMDRAFAMLGLGTLRDIFEPQWFALRNFHCGYFEDSHVLDGYLHHFRDTLDDQFQQLDDAFPAWMRLGSKLAPAFVVKQFMKRMVDPLRWAREDNHAYMNAFFGSREAWESIPDWHAHPPYTTDHAHPPSGRRSGSLPLEGEIDVAGFAESRGGKCLGSEAERTQAIAWECNEGHRFEASPRLLMEAGYWCPECAPRPDQTSGWEYERRIAGDPLLARFHRAPAEH